MQSTSERAQLASLTLRSAWVSPTDAIWRSSQDSSRVTKSRSGGARWAVLVAAACPALACGQPPSAAVPKQVSAQDAVVVVEASSHGGGGAGHPQSDELEPVWVSAGVGFACAVTAGGNVLCWGEYRQHEMEGLPAGMLKEPTRMPGIERALQVAVSPTHACVLLTDGTVRCWGANDRGQCGTTPSPWVSAPTEVSGLPKAQHVAVGERVTCAVAGEELYCWGDDPWFPYKGHKPQPTLQHKGEIRAVRLAIDQACVIVEDGLWCMGAGHHLGWRTDAWRPEGWGPPLLWGYFTKIAGGKLTDVMAGTAHTCALRASGTVQCWGNMQTSGPRVEPGYKQSWALDFEIADAKGVDMLGGGEHTTCLVQGGRLKCRRGAKALVTPIDERGGEVRQLSVRDESACALLEGGAIWCWGAKMEAAGMAGRVPWKHSQQDRSATP